MAMPRLCQRSITINLSPTLDAWVRREAKRRRVSMNQIVNEAMGEAMGKGGSNAKQSCVGRHSGR